MIQALSFGWRGVIIAVSLVLLSAYLALTIASYRRLRAFNGPFWASISLTWLAQKTISGGLYLTTRDISNKYGHLARIGPNLLLTDDPVLLRRISAARSTYVKGEWYDGVQLDRDTHNTISDKDEQRHTEMRAKVANGYGGKDNPDLEGSIDKHITELVQLIGDRYLSTNDTCKVMDWAHIAQYFTIDVLTDVAFSSSLGYLKNNADMHDYIKTIVAYMPVLEMQTNIPLVNTILGNKFVRKLMAPTSKDVFGLGKMMGVAKQVAGERFGPDAKAESEALLQIMVGSDSTATAVRCIFYFIITNPRIYNALVRELDTALPSLTRPVLRDSESRNLPYLQACIVEGLRVWPPVASLIYKITPPEGDTHDGMFIPGGTRIGYSAWALHHSKEMYGADADVYRPERWLEATGEKLKAMERSVELIFGTGKYGCLGKTIAFLELNKVFAE
ncbi:Cytochrome P450 monooxygenase mpaDE [Lachnellula suecica]|uniref:Cytochrome P450 monooxygenase mpaDE n=1 Tax=Lachnellula suecica TaxID=602035 RepID=A0A8T9CAY1_9HELO|nr:Cytochrome P450 monooxygenase mpaDE [Lachnellula suecica]